MKRISLMTFALVGFMLMTGCKKEEPLPEPTPDPTPNPTVVEPTLVEPTLTLKIGEGYLAEGDEITMGETIMVGFECTGEKLGELVVTFKMGETMLIERTKTWENDTISEYETTLTLDQIGDITMTAVLTDTQNLTDTLTFNFKSISPFVPDNETHYLGSVTLNATATALTFTFPIDTQDEMEIIITDSQDETSVNATIIYGGNTYSTSGTKDGDSINFEPFDYSLDFEGSIVVVTLEMTGTVGDAMLSVEGTLSGTGNITIPDLPFSIPATIEGTITGDLNEVE